MSETGSEILRASVFVIGFFAWTFGIAGGIAWIMVSSGNPENPWLAIPLVIAGTGLVWGGFFVGLRWLVGE